jgi:hypothetical protein
VPNCFPPAASVGDFETQWFCTQLLAAGESSLAGDRVFRFTYLPTFHATRVVVVAKRGQEWVAVGKVLDGQGGYVPGKVARTTERRLLDTEVRLLEQRLRNAGMWERTERNTSKGLDGSEWLLEGRRGGQYIFHEVWSPTETTFPQYRKVCIFMLELAGIQPEQSEQELY